MNLEELKKLLADTNAKIEEKRNAMDSCTDLEQVKQYRKENDSLIEQRGNILGQIKAIEEMEAKEAFRRAEEEKKLAEIKKGENVMNLNKREALALVLGAQIKRTELTEEQQRAVGTALGTTATTFVQSATGADGVSNFGVAIPTNMILELLDEAPASHPILADVKLLNVAGMTDFPYRKSRTTAHAKEEGKKVADAEWEMASLEAKKGWIQTTLPVTEEVLALGAPELGEYIINLIMKDMLDDLEYNFVYGTGANHQIGGITMGATTKSIAVATLAEDLATAVGALPRLYAKGAKVYASRTAYNKIAMAKDGAGHYVFTPFSASNTMYVLGCPIVLCDALTGNDVVIGNVSENFKGNTLRGVGIEKQKDITKQVHTFAGSTFVATAPVPNAFIKATIA